MTVMELLRGGTPSTEHRPDPGGLRRALLSGAGTAAASAAVFVLPALLVWVAAAESTVTWTRALGTGAALWLLGGGAHLDLGDVTVTVVPLLFLAIAVGGARWIADKALGAAADERTVRPWAGLLHARFAIEACAWFGGYVVGAAVVALVAAVTGPDVVAWTLVGPVVVVPALAVALAVAAHVRRRPELLGERARRPAWLPDAVRRGLRPGLEGVAALVLSGLVACVVMVVVHLDRVTHLQGELAPGLVGGVVLVAAQVLVLPNLALWAVSFLAGTGFSAVEGASATWTGSRTSVMPLVPVLGALPQPGAFPGWVPVLVLVPVGVGVLVGWRALRSVSRLSSVRTKLTVAGVAVLVTALGTGLVDVVGGRSLGAARLSEIGAPAGAMTFALFVEVAVGASLVLAWDRWKLRR